MFFFREPIDAVIGAFLQAQAPLDFTYAEIGATAAVPPANYVVDRTRVRLGTGEECFCRAKRALEAWQQFNLGWLSAIPADTPICAGAVVAVKAYALGMWTLSSARIVYVVEEPRRFGFAYGTLPGHIERGEERFLIDWDDDDSVWYDILAFSQPRHPLTKLGYPLVRRLQKRFGRESAAAMLRAVSGGNPLKK